MDNLLVVDWGRIFAPTTPFPETFIRGSVTYLTLFALLRVLLKRESGSVGIADLLVVVLLADAIQNGMSGDYRSITDGILLVITILFWSYTLDWLAYRFPRFQRLVHPSPLILVEEGQMIRRNMRQELITKEELMELIREQGVEELDKIKRAYIEGNGQISVITYDEQERHPRNPKKKAV